MLKRTLYFGNPSYLHAKNKQLVFKNSKTNEEKSCPIEDIGFVILDHRQITVTPALIEALTSNNVAVVFCDSTHHPQSMVLNLDGHHLQSALFRHQIESSVPLKKNLWKQTIEAKIENQKILLKKLGREFKMLNAYKKKVNSGDSSNCEAVASRFYWKNIFENKRFRRLREGDFPNPIFNYGYAILRAAVARALVGSGLLPTLGIHHRNQYNAYCLADDIMEPYRPFVDEIVVSIYEKNPEENELTKDIKRELLQVLAADVKFPEIKRPLMIGLSQTTASLARCFSGTERKISYPKLI